LKLVCLNDSCDWSLMEFKSDNDDWLDEVEACDQCGQVWTAYELIHNKKREED